MPNLPLLRHKVRQAIRSGILSSRRANTTCGGLSSGGLCNVCGLPVRTSMMELEIEFLRDDIMGSPMTHRLHHGCFTVWEVERG